MEEKYITIDMSSIVKWLEEAIAKKDWGLVKNITKLLKD